MQAFHQECQLYIITRAISQAWPQVSIGFDFTEFFPDETMSRLMQLEMKKNAEVVLA
jgi:hypothetical protein